MIHIVKHGLIILMVLIISGCTGKTMTKTPESIRNGEQASKLFYQYPHCESFESEWSKGGFESKENSDNKDWYENATNYNSDDVARLQLDFLKLNNDHSISILVKGLSRMGRGISQETQIFHPTEDALLDSNLYSAFTHQKENLNQRIILTKASPVDSGVR